MLGGDNSYKIFHMLNGSDEGMKVEFQNLLKFLTEGYMMKHKIELSRCLFLGRQIRPGPP